MHNENRYRWYDPNTNTYGQKLTFKELMYTFYEKIRGREQYNWRTKKYEYEWNGKSHYRIECEFSGIGHTDNDVYWVEPEPSGYWQTEWRWVPEDLTKYTINEDGETVYRKMILMPFRSYVRYPKIKKFRPRIVDSWDRTISSGFLKAEYKKYIPDVADKPKINFKYRLSKWGRRNAMMHNEDGSLKGYKYRQGPVPCTSGYWDRGRGWHRYKGKHCGIKPWKRDWYAAEVDRREIRDEYGVTFKMPDKAPYPYHRTRQRGWKRTRKKRQWMKVM